LACTLDADSNVVMNRKGLTLSLLLDEYLFVLMLFKEGAYSK